MKTRFLPILLVLAAAPAMANPLAPPLCGTEGTGSAPARRLLWVATFNVLHGLEETAHSTLDERLEIAATQLAVAKVDIVGLQEVSLTKANPMPLPPGKVATEHDPGLVVKRLAEKLNALTGDAWHWCWYLANPHFPDEPDLQPGGGGPLSEEIAELASARYASFKEGSAVLSRHPIEESEARRLPGRVPAEAALCPPPEEEPECQATVVFESRVALWARIDTPGGKTDIVTTHLSHDLTAASDESRFEQAAAVLAFAEEKFALDPPAQRFLTCDCNAEAHDSKAIAPITLAGWRDTYAALKKTACRPDENNSGCTADQNLLALNSTTTKRIDYVFWRAGASANAPTLSRKIANAPMCTAIGACLWPSDHHGVATAVRPFSSSRWSLPDIFGGSESLR